MPNELGNLPGSLIRPLCGLFWNLSYLTNCTFFHIAAAVSKSLQSYPTVRPHRRQPTRLPHPWDSPGKNTGVGCHFLLQCMKGKRENDTTLSDPMDCSLLDSSVHGIFQALEHFNIYLHIIIVSINYGKCK